MPMIKLNKGLETVVDDDDYPDLVSHRWYLDIGGYAYRTVNSLKRASLFMHRVIMLAPPGIEVDHINGDKLDNRKENLRLCSHAENMCNRKLPSNSTSGYKGVSWYPPYNRWCAKIKKDRRSITLGYFDTAELAARKYDQAAIELFGAFARTNF